MSSDTSRSRVIIVDSRSPCEPPLQAILERAMVQHDVEHIAASDHVLDVVLASRPAALLLHAGLERRPELPAAGPLIAALCKRQERDLSVLLYTGTHGGGYESVLAQLGVLAPVVFDQRLVADFERIIANLVEHAAASTALRSSSITAPAGGDQERLPPGFRVELFLDQAELALTRLAIHEHPDRTEAAAAVRMSLETFDRYLQQRSLLIPRRRQPDSLRDQSLLWCSDRPAPLFVRELCEAMDLDVHEVPPGALRPRSVLSFATAAAVVEPISADSAADIWTLARSVRPFLLVSQPPPAVRLLLELTVNGDFPRRLSSPRLGCAYNERAGSVASPGRPEMTVGRAHWCVVVAAIAIAVPMPARGRCVRWPSGTEINVYVNRRSFTDQGFDGGAVEHLVRAAVDEWSTSGRADIRLRYAGLRDYAVANSTTECSNTGQDVIIQMNPGTYSGCGGILALAECDDDTSPAPCCVRVWDLDGCASSFTEGWPALVGGNPVYSLWDVVTHELGHVLCLPHSNDFGDPPLGDPPAADSNHVMYAGAQTTTTMRFLKPHDIYRLLAPRTDPVSGDTLEYGDQADHEVVMRYDADGNGMAGSLQDFAFPGDPQDGVGLDIEGGMWVAAWSDANDGSQIRFSKSFDGLDWDAPMNVGGAHSVQVPAIATNGGGNHVVAYLSGYARGGDDPDWSGTGRSIYVRRYPVNNAWSSSVLIGTSYSGPALAYFGGGCFIIAYVTTDSSCPDCIRTKTSCDWGATWGSEYTSETRSTDRPAIAWGSNGAWGGILWTTNVRDDGSPWGNHVRHGRLGNAWGYFAVYPSALEATWRYTSNFPALTVSDSAAPEPNRYVRIRRNATPEGPVGSGRQISSGYLDDLTSNAWVDWCCSGDSYSPPSAGYSWVYNEFWTLFDQ